MPILCGIAKNTITPKKMDSENPLYIAGYATMNAPIFTGIHDPIYIRAIILSDAHLSLVLVSVDCIGLLRDYIAQIKTDLITLGFQTKNIFIFATHTHAAPDTMGLWGPYLGKSGISPTYLHFVKNQIFATVQDAQAHLIPAQLSYATQKLDGFVVNYRQNGIVDQTLHLIRVFSKKSPSSLLATFWTFTAQPECTTRENTLISADYPGFVNDLIEHEWGGIALFALGLCGSQSPKCCEAGYSEMEEFGRQIFAEIRNLASQCKKVTGSAFEMRTSEIKVPLHNSQFELLFALGIFNREYNAGNLNTTISKVRVGSLDFVMFPGEPFPGLVQNIFALIQTNQDSQETRSILTLSLVNDSLGYFIPKEEFRLVPQEWADVAQHRDFIGHELESIGWEAADLIRKNIKDMFTYKKILAIGSHADDLTIFAGGLLRKMTTEGNTLICVRITDDFDDCLGVPREEAIRRNRQEVENAYKLLGAQEIIHLAYPSDHLVTADYLALRGTLIRLIRQFRPDMVVSFDLNGTDEENMDHIITARAVNEACWQASFDSLYPEHFQEGLAPHCVGERVLFARNPTVVNYQVDITDYIEEKIQAVAQQMTVMENFFHQYKLLARANHLMIELLEADLPAMIKINLLGKVMFGQIGAQFGAKYGEVFNHIDAGFLKDFASE